MTKPKAESTPVHKHSAKNGGPTKLGLLVAELGKPSGASIAELVATTGWQSHSVRGAMAGSLKRKGHIISSSLVDGVRRYRLEKAAS